MSASFPTDDPTRENPTREDPLEIGYISAAHGVRGEVKVRLHDRNATGIFDAEVILARDRSGRVLSLHLERARPQGKGLVASFVEIRDRTTAESLKGAKLLVHPDALPPLEDDEVYLESLRGLQVSTEDGRELGEVTSFLLTNIPILVIRKEDTETLVPILDDTLRSVDEEAGCAVVRVAPGLLD